ncbi:MAG: hypothetical protein CVU64_21210 [Deltaproteobacteria bacterium HGW-Deltaproteobacteria-21]|nr:MAG: hypothetical protein CVU64_21210 [Deltaproteobacteria bacterium HGW-Deltaproteobacteria-21]
MGFAALYPSYLSEEKREFPSCHSGVNRNPDALNEAGQGGNTLNEEGRDTHALLPILSCLFAF